MWRCSLVSCQGTWQHGQAERVHVSHLSSRERKGHKRERGNKEKETDLVSFFPLQHAHFSVDLLIYFSWCGSVLSNNTCHQEKERLEETREKGTKGERNVCGQERFPSYTKPLVATTFSTRSEDRCGCVCECVKTRTCTDGIWASAFRQERESITKPFS